LAVTVSGGTPEARGPPAPSAGQVGMPGLSESVNCFCCRFYRYLIEVDSKNETDDFCAEEPWTCGGIELFRQSYLIVAACVDLKGWHCMRIGTLCKIFRNSKNLPLRKFAALIGLPHSSIAALESGWLAPTANTVAALLNYLSSQEPKKYHYLARYIGNCFLKEYAFRLSADNPLCHILWCAIEVLKAFLDSKYTHEAGDFIKIILPERLLPSEKDPKKEIDLIMYSYLWSLINNDIFEYSALTTETKFKIIVWLAKEMRFLKPEEAYSGRLNQPSTKKYSVFPSPRICRSFGQFVDLVKQDPPDWVPDVFTALDIILLLCDRVELNPLNPGEVTAYLTSHSEKQKKVRSFHPPRIVANYLPDFHSPV
jgi:transcriptional regulator with XRE-family HTH domain